MVHRPPVWVVVTAGVAIVAVVAVVALRAGDSHEGRDDAARGDHVSGTDVHIVAGRRQVAGSGATTAR